MCRSDTTISLNCHLTSNQLGETLHTEISQLKSSINQLLILLTTNECLSSPCKNGGICEDLFNTVYCKCLAGWEGTTCERDIDECVRYNGTDLGCQNGGVCVNKLGAYECLCVNGWKGLHCTRKSTDCNSGSVFEICGHGVCIPENNELGRKCLCDQGWKKDNNGEACTQDVDECQQEQPACSKNPSVSCVNTPGSFKCGPCPSGYTGNGFYCADINECELFNGGCSMNPRVECRNIPGSRVCGGCPPGYVGNGETCIYQGLCRSSNGNCHPLATCRDFPSISSSYVECTCPSGYFGHGIGPLGCLPSPSASPCNSNPCHNGLCISDSNFPEGYICRCNGTYYGKHCENSDGLCSSNPCQNGGTCVNNNSTSYECKCSSGFIGHDCNIIQQDCGEDMGLMEEGIIDHSITFPVSPSPQECFWQIHTEVKKVFNITFPIFQIGDNECYDNFVEIFDGRTDKDTSLGKFCGTKYPKNGSLLTTSNDVLIKLKKTRPGTFKLAWGSVNSKCHELIDLNVQGTGVLMSPGSPQNYPVNRDCYWYIQAPIRRIISFKFPSLNIGNDTDCSGDYLEFSSSFTKGEDIISKICGSSAPSSLISPGPEVLVHFHSDDSNTYPGFKLSYSLRPAACGETYTSASANIISESPNLILTSPVASIISCFYQIKLKIKLKIKLTFTTLSTVDTIGCAREYVALYDGLNTTGPLIGRYCGNTLPSTFIADSANILITFEKELDTTKFRLKYDAVCGGTYEAPSGFVQSEGYPHSYLDGLSCVYLIKQPPGATITLEIQDLEFEYYSDDYDGCLFDLLEIRDGDNENSTLIGNFCDSSESQSIISSTNNLWIKFVTDSSESGKGFKAKYTTAESTSGCGVRRNRTGVLEFKADQNGPRKCRWVLQAPLGFMIQITWVLFEVPKSYQCSVDYVSVYENNTYSKDAQAIGTYCGTNVPPSLILIPSNTATIRTSLRTGKGRFMAHYNFVNESSVCGGNFFSTAGLIKSPNYPNRIPAHTDCVWTINVPVNQKIVLNVTRFEVGIRRTCFLDYVDIRNGGSAYSPLIGRFCSAKIPKVITSHTNQLYIHLVSTISTQSIFMFTWTTTTGCGGLLTSVTGGISSPNYPLSFNQMQDCFWRIMVNQGSLIQLVFVDLDLEEYLASSKCTLDYIEIIDGPTSLSKVLGKYCGTSNPLPVISSSNQVSVRFRTRVSSNGRGFSLRYRSLCSVNVTGFGGVIESPNFPEPYPFQQDCYWNISVSSKNKINITFSSFDLSEMPARYLVYRMNPFTASPRNFLEIKYTVEEDNGEIKYVDAGTFANTSILPLTLMSMPSEHVSIHFRSDLNLLGNGFRLEWVIDGCGGHLKKPGNIQSPNYPKKYPDGIECGWLIEAPVGYSTEITFTVVDVEKENDCPYDGIHIFNGVDTSGVEVGVLCHIDKPVKFVGTGRWMTVRFLSDASYAGTGFTSHFQFLKSKCGGELTAPSGIITSPNYPKNFDRGDSCEWLLTTDVNHVIDLEFQDIDLTVTTGCSDYVKVYDGSKTQNTLLVKSCSNDVLNKTFTSSTNQMLVVFKSSNYWTSLGFKAKYYKACGARIVANETSGNLKFHPFWLPNTERNNKCTWTIVAPKPDQHVSLTITHLNIQSYYDSNEKSSVAIYNGYSSDSPLINKFDVSKLPPTIVSNGVALHVVIDRNVDFFATYEIFGSSCGGTLTGLDGMFSTPAYPNAYAFDTRCEWTLKLAPGNQISLTFQNFDIPVSENCNMDFLEIRQMNATGQLLGVFCGTRKPTNITNVGSLWLYFKSSKPENNTVLTGTAKGFLAEYTINTFVELKGFRGEIASPLYPESFASDKTFTWKISSLYRTARISLEFKDLYTESYDALSGCYNSYVSVYDGPDLESPLLGSYCGINLPDPVESSSGTLFIAAGMNSRRLKNKFLLKWSQVFYPKKQSTNGSICDKQIIDISKVHRYNLTSPGYPNGYARILNCEWIFQTSSMYRLKINFTNLSLASSRYCAGDRVRVYNDEKLVATVCNKVHENILYNSSHTMKVVFTTNSYFNGSGFAAVISEGCGGRMEEPSGVIKFDQDSARDWKCNWTVSVKAGRTIQIDFPVFVPTESDACDNYILLKDGIDAKSPDLGDGKYCSLPPKLTTSGSNLYLEYQGNPNSTIFKARYREILYDCGGSLSISEDVPYVIINSPNYPNKSEAFIECLWIIKSPPGTYMQVDFQKKFHFRKKDGCITEAVELRDGGTHLSPLIGRYCTSSPNTQFSSDNLLFVKFFTEEKIPSDGFEANITIGSCGGTVKDESGEITWHADSNRNSLETNCTWHIIVQPYASINLEIFLKSLRFNRFACNRNGNLAVYSVYPKFRGVKSSHSNDSTSLEFEEVKLGDMCNEFFFKRMKSASNHVIIRFTNIMKIYSIQRADAGFSILYNSTGDCSYTLESTSGIIKSPNYPNLNYMTGLCIWKVTVPDGRRIKINITDFDLERGSSISPEPDQALTFYEFSEYIIDELFYNSTKRIIRTSSNNVMVYFICTASTNARGFMAHFSSDEETLCNDDDFSRDRGTIMRYPSVTKYVCMYRNVQKRPINSTLVLTIKSSLVYKNKLDERSSIQVGADPYGKYMFGETLVSIDRPTSVTVRTAFPEVLLTVEMTTADGNFTIDYEHYPCGGVLENEIGNFNTPGLPKKSNKLWECAWIIKMPKGQKVKLKFNFIDLGDDCDKNFLIIYNGEYQTSPRIGKYCNTNVPDVIISQENNLLLEYHSEENSKAVGFNATYEPVIKGCGGTLSDQFRVVETPNYPQDYPKNVECIWNIVAAEGYHITLKFLGRFQLEDSDGCINDYVQVFDWKNGEYKSLGKLCGRNFRSFFSTENRMKITFRSNDKLSGTGFMAKWETKCGGSFRASPESRSIISPGFPFHYDNDLNCKYYIYSREAIMVEFDDFNLEGDYPSCINDNVTIEYSSFGYRVGKKSTFCGQTKPPKVISRFYATVVFKSDPWVTDKGFRFSFKVLNDCGESITEPKVLTVNLDTRNYFRYSRFISSCLWNITAPKDKIIVLRSLNYSMGYRSCYMNSLEVYDDSKINGSKLLAKICGGANHELPVITTTNSSALIYYKRNGVSAVLSLLIDIDFAPGPAEGCGGFVNLTQAMVLKPPKNISNVDCQWKFEAPENYKIQFKFKYLNIPKNCSYYRTHSYRNCSCSYIEIRDGLGSFSEEIDQICSSDEEFTQKYVTTWKFGFFRFYTNSNSTNAFEVTVTPVKDICGPRELYATNTVQTVTSPGYPNSYDSNIKCLWLIKKKNVIQNLVLKFVDFDLTNYTLHTLFNNCLRDHVEVDESDRDIQFKGTNHHGATESKFLYFVPYSSFFKETVEFCGKELKPFDIFSSAATVNVGFVSTSQAGKGRGFKLEYFLSGCDYNYTQDFGKIMVTANMSSCHIYITSTENTTISLYFTLFQVIFRNTCTSEGLEVYDGHTKDSTLLMKHCKYTLPSPIFSSSNKLMLVWTRANNSRYDAYGRIAANFLATDQGKSCGGTIFERSGMISSPLYPGNYSNDKICVWDIHVPVGAQIGLSFLVFDISAPCSRNNLKITTYTKGRTNERTFCSRDVLSSFLSDSHIKLTYKSSVSNGGRGWSARFSIVGSEYVERPIYTRPHRYEVPSSSHRSFGFSRTSPPFFSRLG